MRRLIYLLVLITGLLGAGVAVAATNHAWGNYHWARAQNPLTLKLGDNVSAAWDSYLVAASADWTKSTVVDTSVVAGNTTLPRARSTPKTCSPTAGRVEVCSALYGRTGWLGVATIWAQGSHITAGTVKLNDTYFNTTSYNKPAWRALVMCQEVGHTLGLAHQDENFTNANLGSCMDYTNSPDSNQHPNQDDYTVLEQIYAHLDSTTSATQSTGGSAPANVSDDPRSWGREVSRSADGRSSTFVLELGRGQTVIRDVFWVEPQTSDHDHSTHQH